MIAATKGIKLAVRAEVRTIEHGAYLIPTLAVGLYSSYPLTEEGSLELLLSVES